MNERIRQLAEQAEEIVFHSPSTGRTTKQLNVEKFAQLIIKEHTDLLRKEWYDLNNQPEIENESPRDIGIRVGRKTEVNVLLEKIRNHWSLYE